MRAMSTGTAAVVLFVAASAAVGAGGAQQRGQGRGDAARHVATQAQVIAEAERIRGSYMGGRLMNSAAFDAAARQRANESLAWLAFAGARYRNDALVSNALMNSYGAMGDYCNGFYAPVAWQAYVGASQWARRRWLYETRSPAVQRDLERYAQSWAAVAAANGSWFWRPPEYQQLQPAAEQPPGVRETSLEPVPLPQVNTAELTAAQREAWSDIRAQFVGVSSRVHAARVLLDGLAGRLAARGMTVNARDGAIALSMQGFLVDAADLITEHEFERAREALTRADYERNKLRGATGQ